MIAKSPQSNSTETAMRSRYYYQAQNFWKVDFELWVGGVARTCTNNLRVVLGPQTQCCPCEASEQKVDQKTKIYKVYIELSF